MITPEWLTECMEEAGGFRPEAFTGIYDIDGMSGYRYRYFINRLMQRGTSYMEIGTYRGSTLVAAGYRNSASLTAIDNWSLDAGSKAHVLEACARFAVCPTIIEKPYQEVNYACVGPMEVFFYDGDHEEKSQYDGLVRCQPALENNFVFICDDWNWPQVRRGTEQAIQDLGLIVNLRKEIRSTNDDSHPPSPYHGKTSAWHNGYGIFCLTKRSEKP